MLTGRCHFLAKITDYDEIGSLRIMTQRNGKLRLKNERFVWLLFQSFDFRHNKDVVKGFAGIPLSTDPLACGQ
jgi:hypothetical protein